MNKIVREFILATDKFVQEMHLKQPGFSCSDCGSLLKTKKELKNLSTQKYRSYLQKWSW